MTSGVTDTESIMNELGGLLARRRDDGEDAGAKTSSCCTGCIDCVTCGVTRTISRSRPPTMMPAKFDAILGELLKDGPSHGIHVLTWIDTLNNLNRTLDRSGQREFEMRVLFQMSANDSSHLIDSPAAANLGLQRALFSSEDTGIQEKYRPWAMPEPAWLQQMAERIRNRG